MKDFSNANLEIITEEGKYYLYNLISDYHKAIQTFGYININTFIQGWYCIPLEAFADLPIGTIVYNYKGVPYKTLDYAYESDNEMDLYVECAPIEDEFGNIIGNVDENNTEIITCGCLYTSPDIDEVYRYMSKNKKEKGEKICPILITKTKQLQN